MCASMYHVRMDIDIPKYHFYFIMSFIRKFVTLFSSFACISFIACLRPRVNATQIKLIKELSEKYTLAIINLKTYHSR